MNNNKVRHGYMLSFKNNVSIIKVYILTHNNVEYLLWNNEIKERNEYDKIYTSEQEALDSIMIEKGTLDNAEIVIQDYPKNNKEIDFLYSIREQILNKIIIKLTIDNILFVITKSVMGYISIKNTTYKNFRIETYEEKLQDKISDKFKNTKLTKEKLEKINRILSSR